MSEIKVELALESMEFAKKIRGFVLATFKVYQRY